MGTAQASKTDTTPTLELVYRVQWGDTNLGIATSQWHFTDTNYRMEAMAKSEGALAFLYEFEGTNTLEGEIKDGAYLPSHFTSNSDYDDENYVIDMTWPRGIQIPKFKVEPEVELDKVHPLRTATLRNVVDPYTAMLMALSDLEATGKCEGSYRVFDGRRRTKFLLKDFGMTEIEQDTDWAYQGAAHRCGTATELIGGHKLDSNYDPEEAKDFEKRQIFVAQLDNGMLMPVRIEISSFLGSLTIRLDMKASQFH